MGHILIKAYLNLYKAFDTVPQCQTSSSPLERHGFNRWTKNWLPSCTQGVVVNDSMSRGRAGMAGIPQSLVLILFDTFVTGMDSGIKCTLSSSLTTSSCVMWLTGWREGKTSRETRTGLRGGAVRTS